MKKCINKIFAIGLLVFAQSAMAADIGVLLGYHLDSATSNTNNVTIDSRSTYMFGGIAFIDLTSQFLVRMGAIYTPRNYGVTAGDIKLTYIDVPAGILWKFTDWGGAFLGANIGLNVSSSCPSTCSGVNSMPTGFQFGMNFKFSPQMGLAMYYESMAGLLNQIDSPKMAALQFLYTFN